MELNPDAAAIAELDAICDEFAQAIRLGEVTIRKDSMVNLEPWVARASPDLRSWLREELCALQEEFSEDGGDHRDPVPEGVNAPSWNAVIDCSVFGRLSYEAKLSLAKAIEPREFDSGAKLLRSGEPASGLYLIASGEVRVVGRADRRQHEIATDRAGGVLGEMSLLTGYPCSADVIAVTPIQAFVLPPTAFDTLRFAHPDFEIALSCLVSERLGAHRRDALCGKSLGGYRLKQCIGGGAMGVVYSAVDESNGMKVALKMLRHRFNYSPELVSRFDQEVDVLQCLDHPNIVSYRGHFVAYSTRFVVLELFDGADLRTLIRRLGPLNESMVRGVLGQVAAGLRHAHQNGVLHLDLKPANLLVNREGRVAVADFGLSRLIETDAGDQECAGTPAYMPPEQFLMADIGPHCDWYSLACVASELISGEQLFQASESSRFLEEKLRPPSSTWPAPEASTELSHCLQGALQPMSYERQLDLDLIASWARPVPELAKSLDDNYSTN